MASDTGEDTWLTAREIIIGVGFLSGLGAEPITVASNAFQKYFAVLAPQYSWIFFIAPYLLIIVSVLIMYGISEPHWLGLLALFLGFVSGVLTLKVSDYFVFLAFGALFIGAVATNHQS